MIYQTIRHLVPNAKTVITGNPTNEAEYEKNVVWVDDRPQPTWAEIKNAEQDAEKAVLHEEARKNRSTAYLGEADPLYFGWQRGENTQQEWLDKVAEIRTRYPYPA